MNLYDEDEMKRKNTISKRLNNYVLIGIILTIVLIISLMGVIYFLIYNPNKITIYLNGKEDIDLEDIIEFKEENEETKIYAPIKRLAKKLEYRSNDGEYTTNFENKDSCYIESENEVTIFKLDSNVIYKKDKTNQNNVLEYEYEEIIIEDPIIKENDTLYVNAIGMEKAFNIVMSYNKKLKKLDIITLDNLIEMSKTRVSKYGEIDTRFVNQKAIIDNMIVVASKEDNLIGVINYETGEEILGLQYDDITYLSSKKAFLVKKNDKYGMIDSEGIIKIKLEYDKLTLMDNENELYIAEKNGLNGVIDSNGNIKIHLEYTKIGVDISQYKENNLKNGYILVGKLIPAQQNEKWRFFSIGTMENLDGTKNVECIQIQNTEFDNIGCITSTSRGTVANLMVIEDYNVVVVQKNNHYGFMDLKGRPALRPIYSNVYMETSSGKTSYYMVDEAGKTYNVVEELEKAGYIKNQS